MIEVKCRLCDRVLEEPGGLAISPPGWPFGMVEKFHICKACWTEKFHPMLRGLTFSIPKIPGDPAPAIVEANRLARLRDEKTVPRHKHDDECGGRRDDHDCKVFQEAARLRRFREIDAFPHTHWDQAPWAKPSRQPSERRRVENEHTHAWSSTPHRHMLRQICGRPECAEFETHNIHEAPDVKEFLDDAIDKVRIRGDGTVLFGEEQDFPPGWTSEDQ